MLKKIKQTKSEKLLLIFLILLAIFSLISFTLIKNKCLFVEKVNLTKLNFNKYFLNISWSDLNSKEFKYSACSTCSNNYSLKKIYNSNGFVSEYAKSTISEDMAETFSFMMSDNYLILDMISKDEILNKKVKLIENLVKKLDAKHQF